MIPRCRPRAGGDPYAAARRCGRAAITETLVVMGPRLRGDDSGLVCAKKYLSTLDSRFRGDERRRCSRNNSTASILRHLAPLAELDLRGCDHRLRAALDAELLQDGRD